MVCHEYSLLVDALLYDFEHALSFGERGWKRVILAENRAVAVGHLEVDLVVGQMLLGEAKCRVNTFVPVARHPRGSPTDCGHTER